MLIQVRYLNLAKQDHETFEIDAPNVPRVSDTIIVQRYVDDGSMSENNRAEQEKATGSEYYEVEKVQWFVRLNDSGERKPTDDVTPIVICKMVDGEHASERHKAGMHFV